MYNYLVLIKISIYYCWTTLVVLEVRYEYKGSALQTRGNGAEDIP